MWFIIALASFIALIILLLCVPLDVKLALEVPGKPRFRLGLTWLFGGVVKEFSGGGKPEAVKEEGKKKKAPGRKRSLLEKLREVKFFSELLRTRGLRRWLWQLLQGIFSSLKVKSLVVDFRVGLDDPADTGVLFAFLGPGTVWLNSLFPRRMRVNLAGAGETTLEGYSRGSVRVIPVRLMFPVLRFIFSMTTVRVLWKLAQRKRQRKE